MRGEEELLANCGSRWSAADSGPMVVRHRGVLGEFGVVPNHCPRRVIPLHSPGSLDPRLRRLALPGPNPAEDVSIVPLGRGSKEADEVRDPENDKDGDDRVDEEGHTPDECRGLDQLF